MNSEIRETEIPVASTPDFTDPTVLPMSDEPLLLPPGEPTSDVNQQLNQIGERISTFLAGLPEYLSEFFGEYRRPLITLGLIFSGILAVKMTLALLDAVDDIPLLAPIFELVGFGYSVWFVYRYLLKASTRQELGLELGELKDQIVGNLPK
ncbi:CAAD domain-containing protein [Phormidium sp. CLA17]|uniref:CAAD domain-containing protein n=1 Tax=Leptolyngbya sp. Cla-17 TaxID=2803751 RepID=UPI001490FF3F|nr:CAAD domain-containing protein [Leptolyngbya sp. Cla-17]MBM0741914.1 CAAD domain-containing protein [Leptolyngbya sp. Cla-17]